jgi:hypothetical protein
MQHYQPDCCTVHIKRLVSGITNRVVIVVTFYSVERWKISYMHHKQKAEMHHVVAETMLTRSLPGQVPHKLTSEQGSLLKVN